VTELLTDDEWRRLKATYEDLAVDVAASFGAVYVRARLLGYLAEASDDRTIREGAEALVEAARYGVRDVSDRFAAFERRLNEFRPLADRH